MELPMDFIPSDASLEKNSRSPTKEVTSTTPRRKNCGVSQNTDIIADDDDDATSLLRLTSTAAATAQDAREETKPTPIRCRWVTPPTRPVARRSAGTTARS
ncbi:Os11g0282900 [Oryza sativa Japonica Group]|uniref:Os11g0282900 protein n=2 Tax=Oryza sativa subsp. japonica TaxID=39947 RepID=Q0ITA6_ORYSJ|nr:hypothetical protein EE612_054779 [Oryza sativa]BAF28059.1 Os11g0282900 [Oryza sativa Japonica Group]BAT13606.1 Os11g0282900 [Oryza sativa Japonica Group]|eukprot:NP_001067696.1 Os11g0282900 [Oryza sativa Japonica Group]